MFKPILLITAILAAVSMAAPADPDFAPQSPAVRSGDVSESNPLEKRSYAASCRSCAIGAGTTFLCSCRRVDGGNYASTILLNGCLGNADGWLTWQNKYEGNLLITCYSWLILNSGNFANSCRDFRYDGVTTRFHVTCRTISGNWIPSSVVLGVLFSFLVIIQCY